MKRDWRELVLDTMLCICIGAVIFLALVVGVPAVVFCLGRVLYGAAG